MGTTTNGLPYPEPTDPIAAGADAIRDLAEAVDDLLSPTVWVAPTLVNGWTPVAPPAQPVEYSLVNGRVYIRGGMQGATFNVICFTLPAGFRPALERRFPTSNAGLLSVNNVGTCAVYCSTSPQFLEVSFDVP